MGCGCGKKAVKRQTSVAQTAPRLTGSSTTQVDSAKAYQSSTMQAAPTGPVTTRKTV